MLFLWFNVRTQLAYLFVEDPGCAVKVFLFIHFLLIQFPIQVVGCIVHFIKHIVCLIDWDVHIAEFKWWWKILFEPIFMFFIRLCVEIRLLVIKGYHFYFRYRLFLLIVHILLKNLLQSLIRILNLIKRIKATHRIRILLISLSLIKDILLKLKVGNLCFKLLNHSFIFQNRVWIKNLTVQYDIKISIWVYFCKLTVMQKL